MFGSKDAHRLVTAIGLLSLYAVATTAYIFSLSPKLLLLGSKQQETLARTIELESRLREVVGFVDEEGAFSVELRPDSQHPESTHAYVKRTSNAYPFATVLDVYLSHSHPAEIRGESLFILRRQVGDEGLIDELWRYSITGEEERLYASTGIDFRAAPSGTLVALAESSRLVLLNTKTGEEKSIRWPELAGEFESNLRESLQAKGTPPDVTLDGWAHDEEMFWGRLGWNGETAVFFRTNPVTGAVKTYDASTLEGSGEIVLHPTTGKVAYTLKGDLHVFDLLQNEDVLIAESTQKTLHPEWIDRETLEYDDVEREGGRVIRRL